MKSREHECVLAVRFGSLVENINCSVSTVVSAVCALTSRVQYSVVE